MIAKTRIENLYFVETKFDFEGYMKSMKIVHSEQKYFHSILN